LPKRWVGQIIHVAHDLLASVARDEHVSPAFPPKMEQV
jgi:hypothetical protein